MNVHLAKGRWLVEVSDGDALIIAVPSNDTLINTEFDRYTQESKEWQPHEGEEP